MSERCTGDCCRAFCLSITWDELQEDYREWLAGHRIRFRDVWVCAQIFVYRGVVSRNPLSMTVFDPPGELLTCSMLTKDGDCSIYEQRPRVCRNYPHGRACRYPGCTMPREYDPALEC